MRAYFVKVVGWSCQCFTQTEYVKRLQWPDARRLSAGSVAHYQSTFPTDPVPTISSSVVVVVVGWGGIVLPGSPVTSTSSYGGTICTSGRRNWRERKVSVVSSSPTCDSVTA
jgi:hypothetical protein